MRRARVAFGIVLLAVGGLMARPAAAATGLTIEPLTWNVIGLDSNNVNQGPNVFPVGGRVCNTGGEAATDLAVSLDWDGANALIQLDSPASVSRSSLAAGACTDVYFNVAVTRSAAAYDTTRPYHLTASATNAPAVTTTIGRELFVEHIVSQQRNSVNSITGPTALTIGDVVDYTVDAKTSPGGYDQLEAYLTLPTSLFELVAVQATYETPAGATNDAMYADACGWDNDPASPTYRSCVGPANYTGGQAGGHIVTVYRVRAVGAGTTTLTSAIYDESGSSFHYNSDFNVPPNTLTVTIAAPAPSTTTTAPATTSTTAAVTATTAPPGTTTTTVVSSTAGLAATAARHTAGLTQLALAFLLFGTGLLGLVLVEPPLVPASRLERAVHGLRSALHAHEGDENAARAWALLDRLDRVTAALRDRQP